MGATGFSTIASGKTVGDAYRAAVDHAHWEYGHGGYSGTIAEKSGWVEFTLPARITSERFQRVVWDALYESWESEGRDQRGDKPKPAKNLATLEGWLGKRDAANILRAVDDKWGPAVAVRLGTTEGRPHIAKTPTGKCKVGHAAYLFFGTASC